jgi:putative PIN family toxin of toxin-antitoxin system
MKVVLDSNVFISSFFWRGNPRRVFNRVTDGLDELYISDGILEEILDVMTRPKFNADVEAIREYISTIEGFATGIITNNVSESVSRDKDDDKVLQCALLGDADYIVTGDGDLLVLEEYQSIKIVTPKAYLGLVSW